MNRNVNESWERNFTHGNWAQDFAMDGGENPKKEKLRKRGLLWFQLKREGQ